MDFYKITSVSAGKCLNIYGNNVSSLYNNQSVCLWADSNTNEQKWEIETLGSNVYVRSVIDNAYGLNVYRSGCPWDCDVHRISGNETDARINFIKVGEYYKIQLKNYSSYYLTAGGTTNGANVYWDTATNSNNQLWRVTNFPDPTRLRCPLDSYISITTEYSTTHRGIDYKANQNTPIKAAEDGTVIYMQSWTSNDGISNWASMGNAIYVQHTGGMTLYMHMNNNPSDYVYLGKTVKKGDIIGLVGTTGNSSGNHLHFGFKTGDSFTYDEVNAHNEGTWVNPIDYME